MARTRRLRIAMIHGSGRPETDGVSDYVCRLTGALAAVGVDAVGVPVRAGGPAEAVRVTRTVRRLAPDVVHVQFAPSAYRFSPLPGLLPLLLPARVPLVVTLHEYGWWSTPARMPGWVWGLLERARWWDRETGRLVPAAAAVVVTNQAHAEQVRRRMGVAPVLVPLAPNVPQDAMAGPQDAPQDTAAGQQDTVAGPPDGRVRQRLGLPADAPLLVFFGFVHPVKGVRYVLEALPELRAAHPGLRLLVVGGFTSQALPADEASEFRRGLDLLARERGVARAVTYTGHLPAARVSELLHAADVAVLPFTEGVTLKSASLLATLAHGVPTAVTVPAEPDPALRDGETVAVIPARRDAAAITGTLRRLLADPTLRQRLAAGGRALVADRRWPTVAAAHHALYRRVCGDCAG